GCRAYASAYGATLVVARFAHNACRERIDETGRGSLLRAVTVRDICGGGNKGGHNGGAPLTTGCRPVEEIGADRTDSIGVLFRAAKGVARECVRQGRVWKAELMKVLGRWATVVFAVLAFVLGGVIAWVAVQITIPASLNFDRTYDGSSVAVEG